MQTKIVLTPDDVKKIVAEKFNIDLSNIWVHCFTTTVGYGRGEREEHTFEIVINQRDET